VQKKPDLGSPTVSRFRSSLLRGLCIAVRRLPCRAPSSSEAFLSTSGITRQVRNSQDLFPLHACLSDELPLVMVQLVICSMPNSNAEVRVIAVYFDLDLSAMSLRQRIAKEDFEICNHLGSAAAHKANCRRMSMSTNFPYPYLPKQQGVRKVVK